MPFIDELRDYLRQVDEGTTPSALEEAQGQDSPRQYCWQDLSRYCLENCFVRRNSEQGKMELTRLGRVFPDLSGRDAVRWLLNVEALQSLGPSDEWRLSPGRARQLVVTPKLPVSGLSWDDLLPQERSSRSILSRLAALKVLIFNVGPGDDYSGDCGYRVYDESLSLLREIADGTQTPMRLLAEAMLADESSDLIGRFRPEARVFYRSSATEATARHARMVAHELRNTLVPIQTALERLYEKPDSADRYRSRIDKGIERMFRYVEEMVGLSESTGETSVLFDPLPAIRDAEKAYIEETESSIQLSLPDSSPLLRGLRYRFVLALLNLWRNSFQVAGPSPDIRVAVEADEYEIVVTVDDNGPGIPQHLRREVFSSGVTLRPGGTGYGLALVREVVVEEMKGSVECQDSPLGGVRFILRMPLRRENEI